MDSIHDHFTYAELGAPQFGASLYEKEEDDVRRQDACLSCGFPTTERFDLPMEGTVPLHQECYSDLRDEQHAKHRER